MRRGTTRILWGSGVLALCAATLVFLATRTDPTLQAADADRPLIIAIGQEPDSIDPTSTRDSSSTFPILGGNENRTNVFEPLVLTPKDGTILPNLARSWQLIDDGRIIEFKLQRGVRFHSGDLLTAEDVVFSHERMLEKSPQYRNWMRNVARAEASDAETVRFHFRTPDAVFFTRVGPVASKTYFERVGEAEFVARPSGTGAYRYVGRKLGQYLDLEAHESYHASTLPAARIRRVRFVFVPDSAARIAMLRAGEADIITDTPYSAVRQIQDLGFKILQVPIIPTTVVQFSNRNPRVPWADPRVRRAIAHAIDAESIVAKVLYGVPRRHAALAPGELGYDPSLEPYAYDPELARRLLAEAGYANGFSMPLYFWAGGFEGVKETAEAVTLNLRAVGITAHARALDGARTFEILRKVVEDDTMEYVGVMPMPIAHTPEPTFGLTTVFHGRSAMAPYSDPGLDELIAAAAATWEPQRRATKITEAFRRIHQDTAAVPLWSAVKTLAMRPGVHYVPASSETVRLANVSWQEGS